MHVFREEVHEKWYSAYKIRICPVERDYDLGNERLENWGVEN